MSLAAVALFYFVYVRLGMDPYKPRLARLLLFEASIAFKESNHYAYSRANQSMRFFFWQLEKQSIYCCMFCKSNEFFLHKVKIIFWTLS